MTCCCSLTRSFWLLSKYTQQCMSPNLTMPMTFQWFLTETPHLYHHLSTQCNRIYDFKRPSRRQPRNWYSCQHHQRNMTFPSPETPHIQYESVGIRHIIPWLLSHRCRLDDGVTACNELHWSLTLRRHSIMTCFYSDVVRVRYWHIVCDRFLIYSPTVIIFEVKSI